MIDILSLFDIILLSCSRKHVDYVIAVIAISSVFWYFWFYRKSKLRLSPPLPPGPWGFPIMGNLPFLQPELHTYFQCLAKNYGPIFKLRLGAKLAIVVTSSEVAHEILRTNDIIFANHYVPATASVVFGAKQVQWFPYGPEWRMLRKLYANKLLSNAMLDSFVDLRRRETRRTVRYLADQARVGSSVNVGEHIFSTVFNVVTQMLWGTTVGEEEREIVGAEFLESIREIIDLSLKPNISDFFPVLSRFDLQGLVKRMRGSVEKMDRLFDRIINQRLGMDRKPEEKCDDFLDALLNVKNEEEEKETKFTMINVKALLLDMVLGGTDTSLQILKFAMAELLDKPYIMERAQQELDEVVGKEKMVEESHIPNLSYILAIMKETLRLHTIVPLLIPHLPSQTIVVGGYTIPKDSMIFFNVWAIHRNPNVWKNPLEFDPDRFLDKSYDFYGNDLNYFPFGSGRRICPGLAMGERVVLYNLATFLHSFDWKIPRGDRVEVEEEFGVVLNLKNSLVATPVIRLSDPNLYL